MPFKKGDKKPENSGRKKGVENLATRRNKALIQKIVDDNADKVQEWLNRTATKNPSKALEQYTKLLEFVTPKAKIEVEMDTKVFKVDVIDD